MPAPLGNTNAVGNEGGRPTLYKEEYVDKVFKLCLLGAIDTEIADFFEVDVDTIYEWKKKHIEFSEAIKKGKLEADMQIAQSLYNRAKGYSIQKAHTFKLRNHTNGVGFTEELKTVMVEEFIPPDNTSMFYWLNNRQRAYWKQRQDIDHTTNGKDINSDGIDYSKLSKETLDELDKASRNDE